MSRYNDIIAIIHIDTRDDHVIYPLIGHVRYDIEELVRLDILDPTQKWTIGLSSLNLYEDRDSKSYPIYVKYVTVQVPGVQGAENDVIATVPPNQDRIAAVDHYKIDVKSLIRNGSYIGITLSHKGTCLDLNKYHADMAIEIRYT